MSFLDKLKARTEELRIAAEDALKGSYASEEIQKTRLDTCLSCEHLFQPTKNCKKCGCFVTAKTKFEHSKCPIGKW